MSKAKLPHYLFKTVLAISLTLMTGLFADNTKAQEAVIDVAALKNAMEEYAIEADRWVETHQHYLDDLQHYQDQAQHYAAQAQFWQQQLIKLSRLQFNLVQMQVNFQERPLDYGMDNACPGSGGELGNIAEGLFEQFIAQAGEDIPTQQRKICQQIVVAKNSKYNTTVALLGRLVQYQSHFLDVETQRANLSQNGNPGDLAANDNEALRFMAGLDSEMRYWQTDMSAYDQYIDDLKDQQAMLAKHAMKGSESSIWSQVVDVVALKAAFSL